LPATPSRWCVYQFRHLGIKEEKNSKQVGPAFKGGQK
jgi:hypothetical protein